MDFGVGDLLSLGSIAVLAGGAQGIKHFHARRGADVASRQVRVSRIQRAVDLAIKLVELYEGELSRAENEAVRQRIKGKINGMMTVITMLRHEFLSDTPDDEDNE